MPYEPDDVDLKIADALIESATVPKPTKSLAQRASERLERKNAARLHWLDRVTKDMEGDDSDPLLPEIARTFIPEPEPTPTPADECALAIHQMWQAYGTWQRQEQAIQRRKAWVLVVWVAMVSAWIVMLTVLVTGR